MAAERAGGRLGIGVVDVDDPGLGGDSAHVHLERAERLANLVDARVGANRLVRHREASRIQCAEVERDGGVRRGTGVDRLREGTMKVRRPHRSAVG